MLNQYNKAFPKINIGFEKFIEDIPSTKEDHEASHVPGF